MNSPPPPDLDRSLDPQDWDSLREVAHTMLDDALDFLASVRERPIWQPIPDAVKARFDQPLPEEPTSLEEVYREFQEWIQPYSMGNVHPRFWAWVIGAGTPVGVLGEMLAATINPNVGGGEQSAAYVERQVVNWCSSMLGYHPDASGLLVSGGSMANLVGLAVARHARAGIDVRKHGVCQRDQRIVVYGSTETHSSVQKALELLGLGSSGYCQLPVDSDYRLDLDALERALERDRRAGHTPCAVVATLGTVNTGACDDIAAIAEICQRHDCWLHVDGAFGALARLCQEYDSLTAGLERADSVAFDLHKWMSIPYEAACVLIRDAGAHRDTFELTPEYLFHVERGLASGEFWPSEYGPQLSRGFKALKVWLSFRTHGLSSYRGVVRQNVDQIAAL